MITGRLRACYSYAASSRATAETWPSKVCVDYAVPPLSAAVQLAAWAPAGTNHQGAQACHTVPPQRTDMLAQLPAISASLLALQV
jgi:hypothetical protein